MPDRTELADRKSQLSEAKKALLAQRLSGNGTAAKDRLTIPQRSQNGPALLSFAQQRLWFLDQLVPQSPFYNIAAAVRLQFALDIAAVRKSVQECVRRHESLRTTFRQENGQAVQIVASQLELDVPLTDLRSLSRTEREAEAHRLAREEAVRPFDLSTGPLLRASLLQLSDREHVLLLTLHHIISDGWSMTLLAHEFSVLYNAYTRKQPATLPALPVQYPDYAVWQRERLQGEVLQKQLSYWRRQLSNLPVLQLPRDRQHASTQAFQGGYERAFIPAALVRRLRTLGQQNDATLFMTMLAAFQALLHRYTGQEDIVVGSPTANRPRPELEGVIGFFVNTLVMRTDLSGDPTFRELLGRVREMSFAAFAHEEVPFEKLVEELQPERDLNKNPLYQVAFQIFSPPTGVKPGASLPLLDVNRGTSIFDLSFTLAESADGLRGGIEYSAEMFDAATIRRLIGHYLTLVEASAENPECAISELPLMTEAEVRRVRTEWNQTRVAALAETCVQHVFEEQARALPNALALSGEGRRLTYGELNARANQLAHKLRQLGIGAESVVAVCMERSIEMVAAELAVLKAGGAYIPLVPSYPKERLEFMLTDSQANVLLTHSESAGGPWPADVTVLGLDEGWSAFEAYSEKNPSNGTFPQNLAYVIYTSGSTGNPKGVEISHRGLMNLVAWHRSKYEIRPDDRATQVATPAFDAAVWEIWPYLAAGASVFIPDETTRATPALLSEWLSNERITITFMPTPLAEEVMQELPPGKPLRLLLTGGDRLTRLPEQRLPFTLINHYGPTEVSVVSTSGIVRLPWTEESAPPIGRAIDNLQTYIVDQNLNLTPPGIPGELLIGGIGLARGYRGRPDLTAAKFIPDPFSGTPGARLYRTGDLVRYLSDGNIEFLGRMDDQVKIRAFRIELGEIEAILRQHPGVKQAVAVAWEDLGERRIAAYIVLDADRAMPHQSSSQPEQVSEWRTIYNETYGSADAPSDPAFHIVGWNSSYTGEPLPANEMREWVEATVSRIQQFGPSRVLEIGCGTGLLLFRIAPGCSSYTGIDFSKPALDHIRRHLADSRYRMPRVELRERVADDFEGIQARSVDTVVLNSVIQYFPSVDYLVRVIEGAVAAVQEGGRIFIGDVRSLPLLEAFHAELELYKAPPQLTPPQLRQRVSRASLQEQELVLAPGFFAALPHYLPQIRGVEVLPKRGNSWNELTRYRYDVVLHVCGKVVEQSPCKEFDWARQQLTTERLGQWLTQTARATGTFVLTNIPNRRVAPGLAAADALAHAESFANAGELKTRLSGTAEGVDLEEVFSTSAKIGLHCEVRYTPDSTSGSFDIRFAPRPSNGKSARTAFFYPATAKIRPWQHYANNPLQGTFAQRLLPELRQFLERRLPEYMIPSAFVVLDEIPLSPNGKLDRRALPKPDVLNTGVADAYVASRNDVEAVLAALWAEILNLEKVSVTANFFNELGGHSLLATRLVSRIRDAFHVDVPLRRLFESPTVAEFSKAMADDSDSGEQVRKTAQLLVQIEAMSDTEVQEQLLERSAAQGARR